MPLIVGLFWLCIRSLLTHGLLTTAGSSAANVPVAAVIFSHAAEGQSTPAVATVSTAEESIGCLEPGEPIIPRPPSVPSQRSRPPTAGSRPVSGAWSRGTPPPRFKPAFMADSAKLGKGKILQRYRNAIGHLPRCCVYFQPNSRQPSSWPGNRHSSWPAALLGSVSKR